MSSMCVHSHAVLNIILYLLFVKCLTESILTRNYQISQDFRKRYVLRTGSVLITGELPNKSRFQKTVCVKDRKRVNYWARLTDETLILLKKRYLFNCW